MRMRPSPCGFAWRLALGLSLACSPEGTVETPSAGAGGTPSRPPELLIFSKTVGYRHASIEKGIQAVSALCKEEGISVVATEQTAHFTEEGLRSLSGIVFLSTTGDVLSDVEQGAFEQFLERGGAFIGVHAAADTEADWPFYRSLLGAHFKSHPAIQEAELRNEAQASHPATRPLPAIWLRRDEWYDFDKNPRSTSNILLTVEERSYTGGSMGWDHPIAWTREVGSSRVFYTALGHTEESFEEPLFLEHLRGGILWAVRLPESRTQE